MGLFSFLTGKDTPGADAPPETTASPKAGPASAESSAAPSAGPSAGSSFYAPSPTPTPFKAPEAWNTESLTAPPPEPTGTEKPNMGPQDADQTAALQGKVIAQLKTVFDPEIPVDIYELGLVYDIIADAERRVLVKMTLTSPACPSAQQIPSEARYKVKAIPEVTDAWVEIVWEPTWDKDRMSDAAKLQLGMF